MGWPHRSGGLCPRETKVPGNATFYTIRPPGARGRVQDGSELDRCSFCLVWASPETKPTSEMWVQLTYLESDPRKKEGGRQEGRHAKYLTLLI